MRSYPSTEENMLRKLGYRKVPVIIRVLSEDDSSLSMVDSNLHRERISYSEKAFAYKLKNDVLKRKSGRKKSQVDHKTPIKRAIEIISEDCGDSPKQVQRYISLTKLIPEMLQKLDNEIISFCPAVEIAALSEKEQRELLVAMEYAQAIPSLSQAQRIRQLSKEKQLSLEKMEEIMCEVKKGEITRVAFTNEQLHKYFPNSYTSAMMKREILALLKLWKKESWESYIRSKPERRRWKDHHNRKCRYWTGKRRQKSTVDRCESAGKFNSKSWI